MVKVGTILALACGVATIVACADDADGVGRDAASQACMTSCTAMAKHQSEACGAAETDVREGCQAQRRDYEPMGCGPQLAAWIACAAKASDICGSLGSCDGDYDALRACKSRVASETGCVRHASLDERCTSDAAPYAFTCSGEGFAGCMELQGLERCCPALSDEPSCFAPEPDGGVLSCSARYELFSKRNAALVEKHAAGCELDSDCVAITPGLRCGPQSGFEGCPAAILSTAKSSFEHDVLQLAGEVCVEGESCNAAPDCVGATPKCVDAGCALEYE